MTIISSRRKHSFLSKSGEIQENDMRVVALCKGVVACQDGFRILASADYLEALASMGKHFIFMEPERENPSASALG